MRKPAVQFGDQLVTPEEKTSRVRDVFDKVTPAYDLMNDLMSVGSHRLLKRVAVETSGLRCGDRALDVASGTGDVARLLHRVVGASGRVVALDVNEGMLKYGRDRNIDSGCGSILDTLANAEELPFRDNYFHAVTIAFGLRNITDKEKALAEMKRVLRPGAKLVVLEFSQLRNKTLAAGYQLFQRTWPVLGQLVVGDAQPYQYLVESIRNHPAQETLALMIKDAGFQQVRHEDLIGGAVALHTGVH